MTITPIGLVLIPLSLAIFVARPKLLVPWAIVVSVFQAASVINLGGDSSIGVAPFFFVVVLIALRFVPQYVTGRFWFVRRAPDFGFVPPAYAFCILGGRVGFRVATSLSQTWRLIRRTEEWTPWLSRCSGA